MPAAAGSRSAGTLPCRSFCPSTEYGVSVPPNDHGGKARYVFGVAFRLDPEAVGLRTDPDRFETTMYRRADPPGEDGWLFFRDHLWHGELADADHFRNVTADALGVPVESVAFRELQTDEAYLERLRRAVGENLEAFRAEAVDLAVSKYLGSSIRVVGDDEPPGWPGR